MDVGPIHPAQAAEKALAAWAAAVEAMHADTAASPDAAPASTAVAPGDLQDPVRLHTEASVPLSEPTLPGSDSDHGHEGTTLQSLWRPPATHADAVRPQEPAVHPDVPAAQRGTAVPDALLAPATLTGLRTEPSMAWALPTPPAPWQPPAEPAERRRQRQAAQQRQDTSHDDDSNDATLPPQRREGSSHAQAVIDADDGGDWQEALSRGLRAQLAQLVVPPALLAASEQWRRGRCVVMACPQRSDPAGPAWAFVLWPRPEMQATDKVALFGVRVDARLQWLTLPPAQPWCHARLMRHHHPRQGRQMVMADASSAASSLVLPCAVQLGPVQEHSTHRCEVRVCVPAAQRFWAALRQQWSVQVIVCARSLLATPPRSTEA